MITSKVISDKLEEYAFMKRVRGQLVEVYLNPTMTELLFIKSPKTNMIRFTANALNQKVYAWDASKAIHYDILSELGNEYIDTRPNIIGGTATLKGNKFLMNGWDNFHHVMSVMDTSNKGNAIQFLTKLFNFNWKWLDKYFLSSDYIDKRKEEFHLLITGKKVI